MTKFLTFMHLEKTQHYLAKHKKKCLSLSFHKLKNAIVSFFIIFCKLVWSAFCHVWKLDDKTFWWLFFLFPPTCNFLHVNLLTTLSDCMKNYIQTNKATTNIFGLHTQPRKTTRYTNILKLVWCGGGGGGGDWKEKEPFWSTQGDIEDDEE